MPTIGWRKSGLGCKVARMSRDRQMSREQRSGAGRLGIFTTFLVTVLTSGLILAGCEGRAGRGDSKSEWVPLEVSGPLAIRLEDMWRHDVSDRVESFGGMAAWDDGVIWIGEGLSGRVWELTPGNGSVRMVLDDAGADDERGATLGMAFDQRHGMYILSRNGVTLVPARGGEPAFSKAHRGAARGFAVLANGDYVVAHGQYPDDPQVDFALHRYDAGGNHVASWHPAFHDEDWVRVTEFSGGPIAVTGRGDLLLSELAPFRITRYLDAMGDSAVTVVEDEDIVSAAEFARAMPAPGIREFQWSHSVYIAEMPDGRVLNVVEAYPGNRRDPEMHWIVLSSEGQILGRTSFDEFHWVAGRSGPNTYLVVRNGTIGEVRIVLAAAQ